MKKKKNNTSLKKDKKKMSVRDNLSDRKNENLVQKKKLSKELGRELFLLVGDLTQ